MSKSRPSENFSLVGNHVRITRGGDRPRLSFYAAQHTMDSNGYLRVESVKYLGWRNATKNERNIIRNFRPSIALVPGERKALASYRNIGIRDRYSRPHSIRPGPQYDGPPKQPIQKLRVQVHYVDQGTLKTQRILYRFYDNKTIQRFQKLEQSGRLPFPLSGNIVDYGLTPHSYRLKQFKARTRGHGS
ncbi:MAG TPA: hypothetical protein VGS11_04580 [Candidatus Bathyarchaeia archaeon]|nr:hypothetical protein [Candidatus Bathyarchaeia archaeon]